MEQAIRDSKASDRVAFPTVFHKKNNKPLMVTMLWDNWIDMYDSYYSDMRLKERDERYVEVQKIKEENGKVRTNKYIR